MHMKTVLVTGGAGFIGSHLCEKLLNMKNRVICVDNLLTGSKDNIAHILDNPNFELIEHDIIEPLYVKRSVDEIYNLACAASPVKYQAHAIHTIKTSTIGVINILELARQKGAVVLQASTSEVYGDPEVHPQVESYRGSVNPIGSRACYDEGKRCAETLFFEYARVYGLKIKVVRIFNTYGPRMAANDGRVVSNFITQALKNKNITVYGKGSQTRSFCYVDDLVEGLIKMMASKKTIVGPINLGNPNEMTVKELAEHIIEMTHTKSKLIYKDLPEDDPTRRKPDIAKAKKQLGWEPRVKLKDGLAHTINYFESL
ncbi:MAG TPA: SDR family oxidoreductase [Candidatus Magasanikbacteria bacterium]|nr:SDR family oxidoreductase [Candidatus Magasanikbacteria bacterium]